MGRTGERDMERHPMNILFVKLGALGDVINTLPLAITLKERMGARIHWLVEPLSLAVVSGHPAVDDVVLFDKNRWPRALPGVLSRIRQRRYDIALDLQRTLKSGLFCTASSSTRRIGFDRARCKELTWMLPFERIRAGDPAKHMVYQYLEFATHLGVHEHEVRWDIPVAGRVPFGITGDYIVLNIGATKPANRWTPEGFARLAVLIGRRLGMTPVLTGGREDVPMAGGIASLAGGYVVDLAGKTSIPELKEVLAGARAVVSCDTGPMHLAVALGKKVVVLVGPSNPQRTGPLRGSVVRLDLPCMPCNRRKCATPLCMLGISPELVMKHLEEII